MKSATITLVIYICKGSSKREQKILKKCKFCDGKNIAKNNLTNNKKQLYKCKDCLKRFIIKQDKAKRLYYDYLDLKISRLSVIYGLSDNKTEIYILVFFY